MNQRTNGATSRTCVHTFANVVSNCTNGCLKLIFKPIYLLLLFAFFSTNIPYISGVNTNRYSEQGTIPEVDIQLQPTKRWKASSESLDFIRNTLKNYVTKEIAEQTPIFLSGFKNNKKSNSLILDGKIVKE